MNAEKLSFQVRDYLSQFYLRKISFTAHKNNAMGVLRFPDHLDDTWGHVKCMFLLNSLEEKFWSYSK